MLTCFHTRIRRHDPRDPGCRSNSRRNALVSFFTGSLLVAATAAASSPQIQVNTFTDGLQQCPHAAPTASGGFLVVWESNLGDTIRMRYLGSDGTPAADAITVSDVQTPVPNATSGCFYGPRTALLSDGSHVVTWWRQDLDEVKAKRFLADGTLAESFDLNAGWRARPSALSGGGFVLVYTTGGISIPANQDVAAQIFANDGTPLVAEFLINQVTVGSQRLPSVASTPDGGFIVVWESGASPGDDNDDFSIQARRFDSLGSPLGDQFQVNDLITGRQQRANLGVGPGGDFIVVWDSVSSAGSDQNPFSIQRRRFASDGTPLGGQSQVNVTTQDWQTFAHVAIASGGEAQIIWESLSSGGNIATCTQR
ncbi:MAG: hypothetical protein AAFY88_21795 [Acidobacteriota bacterium]